MDADCIYVLQDGEIAESGTHSGLIEKNGIFTRMWKNYSDAAAWRLSSEDKYPAPKDIWKVSNENEGLEVRA